MERGQFRPGVQPGLLADIGRCAVLVPEVRVLVRFAQ